MQTGTFIPEKSNIWRDCVDGYYDWVKEHIEEVLGCALFRTVIYALLYRQASIDGAAACSGRKLWGAAKMNKCAGSAAERE